MTRVKKRGRETGILSVYERKRTCLYVKKKSDNVKVVQVHVNPSVNQMTFKLNCRVKFYT